MSASVFGPVCVCGVCVHVCLWTHYDACGPGVEQEDGTDQEGTGQHHADGQQEPVAESDILFPEQEGVAVGVVQHALAAELVAHRPHALDGLHKVGRLPQPVQVEGELGELQRLRRRDWKRRREEGEERREEEEEKRGEEGRRGRKEEKTGTVEEKGRRGGAV